MEERPPRTLRMPGVGLSAAIGAESLVGPPPSSRRAHPIDECLLELLHESFSDHAGPDSRIDARELQRSLDIRSTYLAERVLSMFDRDGDGVVSRGEFLEGVRRLIFGSVRDKLRFAFRIHDLNGDGIIERSELERMIALSLAEESASIRQAEAERLTSLLLSAADHSGDARVSWDEFEAVVYKHPQVLDLITRSEARWIAPNEDLLQRLDERVGLAQRLKRYVENHRVVLGLLAAWVLTNSLLFAGAVNHYRELGAAPAVLIARGCGACLNFNGALILVPVMRRLLTRLRRVPGVRAVIGDDPVLYHRFVAHAMFAFACVHSAAHLYNYRSALGSIWRPLSSTNAGVTGALLLVVFAVMWCCSLPAVRRSGRFELFYFTHLLYVAWLALALLHGPVFWQWALVPLLGYAVELVLRLARRTRKTRVVSAQPLRSGVTRLEIQRPIGFDHRAGDYVFLRVPALARFEWHPFTISSAPERNELTLHVRSLGNWTSALRRLVEDRHANSTPDPLLVHLDGPYGTASTHVFDSRYAVLIGAGIGVTPFASILESIVLRASTGATELQKVHFFWLNRDPYSFEWFAALLLHLEEIDHRHLVDMHICMTGGRGHITAAALNLARDVSHALGNPDLVTGLRTKTQMGAVDWRRELERIADLHSPDTVDVYFCGPPGLALKIAGVCSELGLTFRQEHF